MAKQPLTAYLVIAAFAAGLVLLFFRMVASVPFLIAGGAVMILISRDREATFYSILFLLAIVGFWTGVIEVIFPGLLS